MGLTKAQSGISELMVLIGLMGLRRLTWNYLTKFRTWGIYGTCRTKGTHLVHTGQKKDLDYFWQDKIGFNGFSEVRGGLIGVAKFCWTNGRCMVSWGLVLSLFNIINLTRWFSLTLSITPLRNINGDRTINFSCIELNIWRLSVCIRYIINFLQFWNKKMSLILKSNYSCTGFQVLKATSNN